jgi:SNF2 family DNA or RNA helicase
LFNRKNLHVYQEKAIDFIIEKKRCALWLGLGLGKSVITLTAISDMLDALLFRRVLVIAPLRVANSVWAQEVKKWGHLNHLKVSVCTGSEKQRIAGLMRQADIYVINRENVHWLVDLYNAKWPFDCVVIDESSSFKNPSSRRFKKLKKILPYTDYLIELTGTPSPNGLLDLWAQMYLIDYGRSLGRTMSGYKKRFFESDYMGYKWSLRPGSEKMIHSLIADKVLSMSTEDYLHMPERIDLVEEVRLPKFAISAYMEFEENLLLDLPDGEELEASTAAVLAGKLLQMSNGAVYTDESRSFTEIHDAKLDRLEEIMEENEGENILVAYNYQHDLVRIKMRFPNAVVLDNCPSTIERWNRGEISMLLAHPQSASMGLNLQSGGCVCVWFGLTWNLQDYLQFNGRLHRQGQTRPVRILHIVSKGCIDERVLHVLKNKDSTQQSLLSALKPKK